jgi:nucleotide-binding universal stress UspA family protein
MSAKPIIVAVDPHRDDFGGTALGLMLARIAGAPLVLVSVYPVDPAADLVVPAYAAAMRAKALQAVEATRAAALAQAGGAVQISSTVLAGDGSPAKEIHVLAERERAMMIVVGSSSRGAAGRMLPGAVTDRVLHGAPCPVAVATAGFSGEPVRLIGVAFVDRPDGRAALAFANELARDSGALLLVLTAREPVDWRFTTPFPATQLAAMQQAREEAAERTARAGLAAVPKPRSAGSEVLGGRPQDALAAASADLDLLVCGSRGYGPVRTLLLGGVSHSLVREAACPVLVVPLADEQHAAAAA